jgi:hypothetical protein
LKNTGFAGIVVRKDEKYHFSMFSQLLNSNSMDFLIILQTPKGKVLAQNKISVSSTSWQKYNTELIPTIDSDSATLVVLAKTSGVVALDMISLFPEKTFKNRPNGLRADMAQVLADMKPRFIRFPGGCLNGPHRMAKHWLLLPPITKQVASPWWMVTWPRVRL